MSKKLSQAALRKACSRHNWALQWCWNYEKMQAAGYAYAMVPIVKELYDGEEEQCRQLERHMQFYNTHPGASALIFGAGVALEEAGQPEVHDNLKVALMGPLAGIGDSMKATTDSIFGAICASIAMGGSILGAILYEILNIIYYYVFGYYTYNFGYTKGMSFLTEVNESGILDRLMDAACTLGMMSVGALIPAWCSFNLNHDFVVNDVVINLQNELNNIMPGLAPLGLTLILAGLYSKRVNSLKLVLGMFVVAFLLALVGFGG